MLSDCSPRWKRVQTWAENIIEHIDSIDASHYSELQTLLHSLKEAANHIIHEIEKATKDCHDHDRRA